MSEIEKVVLENDEKEYGRALTAIKALIDEGRCDGEAEALRLAKPWPELVEYAKQNFVAVRATRAKAEQDFRTAELEAAAKLRAKPEPEPEPTKVREPWRRSFVYEPPKPGVIEAKAEPAKLDPDPEPGPKVSGEPNPQPVAPEPPTWRSPLAEVAFAADGPDHDVNDAILSVTASYDNARSFVRRRCYQGGVLSLYRWREKWWQWNTRTYTELSEGELRSRIYGFLDASSKRDGKEGQLVRFKPTPRHINDLLDGLKAGLMLPSWAEPPMRLDTGERLGTVMMFANGLFDLRTGEVVEPTAAYWLHHEVPYELLFDAECREWLAFLDRAFPGDPDAHALIEEMLGLSMTEDLSFQKGMLLIGEPRSGKGTLLKLLEGLIGSDSYATADVDTWFKSEFSQEGLIGKKAIAMPDVRLQPAKWYGMSYDAGGLDHKSIARLLKIIAGDTISVARKYQGKPWEGKFPGKVWIASNKVPNFNDATLPTRFVKLWFRKSYLNREDIHLADKLLAELPGIAARCINAYARLRQRGRFIQPSSSDRLEAEIRQRSDAFTQWVEETFAADPNGQVKIGVAFGNFELWCGKHGHSHLLKSITSKNLRNYLHKVPGFEHVTTCRPNGSPVRYWAGIRFREAEEASFDDVIA
jgi:putative DNA primase/helicase